MDMNHLIGQRFNLISKSDIRYVGTLHEINPEASTIALENVVSHGTEGRRGNPADEVPASTSVYEYIVFRGSDVKDISVAEEKKEESEPKPPQVPNDPAILGSMSRPGPPPGPGPQGQQPPQPPQGARPPPPPGYPQQPPPFQGYYPPYGQRFGPPGYPPGPGFPPYGAPPGWFPPPGPGFPHGAPGQFSPSQGPIGPPGQPGHQHRPGDPGAPPTAAVNLPKPTSELPVENKTTVKTATSVPAQGLNAPTPPAESKPSVSEALHGAVPAPVVARTATATAGPQTQSKVPPTGPMSDRFVPAIPLSNPAARAAVPTATGAVSQNSAQAAITEATRAATAAVAAAMAKLPQPNAQKKGPQNDAGLDAVTKKFNDTKLYDGTRGPRGGHQGLRGGRGGHRGGHQGSNKKIEVPDVDFDFQSSNAKFNKVDLVKEAIASGSPLAEEEKELHENALEDASVSSTTAHTGYNKTSSFFDNISSETRDREEGSSRPRERRGEEQKKNIETFGQGSVDGYRGGYRGRGRGRGYGGPRGRGGYNRGYGNNRGRGGFRGGRDASASTGVPTSI